MFKLLRYFSITSLVAFIIVAVVLGQFYRQTAINALVTTEESKNVALTQAFANSLWPQFAPFVNSVAGLNGDELRARPETAQLQQAVLAQMKGLSVVKVKVYDLNGLTVFSTQPSQMGEDKSNNAGYLSARLGQVASELTHRDTFSAFEGEVENLDVFSSYIPIRRGGPEGSVEGVFELYTDITPLVQKINDTQRNVVIVVTLILALLYAALFLIVRRADGIIRQQYAEIKRAEETAQKAKGEAEAANQAKTEFVSFIAHELRLPLTSIRGYAELILAGAAGETTEQQANFLNIIRSNIERMVVLISDLADISRIESGHLKLEFKPLALSEIIAEVLKSLSRQIEEKQQALSIHIPDTLPQVWGDPTRLAQVLTNLVSNAYKYTPIGGQITISAEFNPESHYCEEALPVVRISVQDTGLGISQEDQRKIFGKFFRAADEQARAAPGTGLGLNITKYLVEAHGGCIWFESEFRQGTTFHFTIPTNTQAA